MTEDFEFDETATGRFLILSDSQQEFPTERLKVASATTKNGASGKPYAQLTLKGEDSGAEYQMACYSRDVQACVKQWGKKVATWGFVTFEKPSIGNRRALIPCENQKPVEEPIGAQA